MNYFEIVYHLAKVGNQHGLDILLRSGVCNVDEFADGKWMLTAAGQLAFENNSNVWLLIFFGANRDYAAQGAAAAGHFNLAHYLSSKNHYIARGAAIGGYFQEIPNIIPPPGSDLFFVMLGAALQGHVGYVMNWIDSEAPQLDVINWIGQSFAIGGYPHAAEHLRCHYGASIGHLAFGAAAANDRDYVQFLQQMGARVTDIVRGAAQGNHTETALSYLRDLPTEAQEELITHMVYGAGLGGHSIFAAYLLSLYPDRSLRSFFISGAIEGRHFNYAMMLEQQSRRSLQAQQQVPSAAEGGRFFSSDAQLHSSQDVGSAPSESENVEQQVLSCK